MENKKFTQEYIDRVNADIKSGKIVLENGELIISKSSKVKKEKASNNRPKKKISKGKAVAIGLIIAAILTASTLAFKINNSTDKNINNNPTIVETIKDYKVITSYEEAQALVEKAYTNGGWTSKLSDMETFQIQSLAFQQQFYLETGKELTADEAMNFLIYNNIDKMSSDFLVNQLGFNNKTAKNVAEDSRNILAIYKIASDGGLDVKSLGYATASANDAKYYAELNDVLKSGDQKALDEFALKFEADLLANKTSLATSVAGTMALYNIAGVKGLSGYADVAVTGKSAPCENEELTMSLFSENNAKLDQQLNAKLIQGATESIIGLQMAEANDNIAAIFFLKNPTTNNAMEAKKEAVRAENDAVNFKIPAGQEVKPSDKIQKDGTIDSGKRDYVDPKTKEEQQKGTSTVKDNNGNVTTKDELEGKTNNGQTTKNGDTKVINGKTYEYKDGQWFEQNSNAGKGVVEQQSTVTPVQPQSAPVQETPKKEEPKQETQTQTPQSNVQETTKYYSTCGEVFNSEAELIAHVVSGNCKTK